MWFNRVGVFSINKKLPLYTIVEKEEHYNFIDANGKFLRGWFQIPYVNCIDYGYIFCQEDGEIKIFDLNMKELNIKEVLENNNLYLEDYVDEDTGDVLTLLRQRRD